YVCGTLFALSVLVKALLTRLTSIAVGLGHRLCGGGVVPMGQYAHVSVSNASRRRLARHLVGLPLRDIERDLVLETLARTDGNRTVSARLLGLSIRTLRNKIIAYSAD